MPNYPQKRPDGPFEARSYMPHRGRWFSTRHHDRQKAERRLQGNPRHTDHHIVDHTVRDEPQLAVEPKAESNG